MRRISLTAAMLATLITTAAGCEKPADTEIDKQSAASRDTNPASSPESTEPATPDQPAGKTPASEEAQVVAVGQIQLTAPDTWKREQPRSDFIEAEFSLPKVEGDERDGRLTISMAGGTVEANIDRWRGQFGGQPAQDHQKDLEVDGTTITIVDLGGTYQDGAGPFAAAVERPGYRMLAAIIPGDEILYFVKAYGPQPTMAHHQESFESFLKTLEKQ